MAIPATSERWVRLERGYLGCRIQLGCCQLNCLQCAPPMAHPKEWLGRQTLRQRPGSPLLLDVTGRVNQHTIQIEQNRSALESLHGCSAKAVLVDSTVLQKRMANTRATAVFLTPMRDLLDDYARFVEAGTPFGRAVVTSVWGSAPRPEGSSMLATADGRIAGSVSGGCVEAATALEIQAAIQRGTPKLVTFGVSDERAWEVGLACGGTIKVFVEPTVRPEILQAAQGPGGEVVATVVAGPALGESIRVLENGAVHGRLSVNLPTEPLRDSRPRRLAP